MAIAGDGTRSTGSGGNGAESTVARCDDARSVAQLVNDRLVDKKLSFSASLGRAGGIFTVIEGLLYFDRIRIVDGSGAAAVHFHLCWSLTMFKLIKRPATQTIERIIPRGGISRAMTISVRNKEGGSMRERPALEENPEPVVAFNRPPSIPPLIGPLVLFTLLEMSPDDD
ncbi:uncharacterized protein LOC144708283 [Wolffia australiana]